MPQEAPVLIVGAGPVAMTAALLLARFGVRSVMLEAKRERDVTGSRALCMQRDVLDILDRIGDVTPLLQQSVTWNLGRTYFREHELFQTTFPDAGRAHFPPFVNVGQDRTECWLESLVDRCDLTEVRYGHEVVELASRGAGVEVAVATHEGRRSLSGRYLVAADGSRSASRKRLDVGFPGTSFDDRFLICDIRAALPFANERRFFFDPEWNPGRQVLIHPQAESVWRIDWQVPHDFDLEAERATGALDDRIRRIAGDAPYEIVWMSVYRFHQRMADRFAVGRSLLAGDAAHLTAPFGARGLNSGIQDADNLAWKLAYVIEGWAPESLLRTYDSERRGAAEENLKVTSATMEFLVPQGDDQWRRRRDILERAVTDEAARRLVDSGKLAEPYWYLDSPLTTPPARQVEFPRDPCVTRPVVPGVLCPDLPLSCPGPSGARRLRELLGRGLVIVGTAGATPSRAALADVPGPVATFDLDTLDGAGILRGAVGTDGEVAVVVRPDGHIGAIVDSAPRALAACLRAIGGLPSSGPRA
jgi:2-polyprenyl-6-methoxyphenol hydroxylase-like FAD-dependent oxidoreductase